MKKMNGQKKKKHYERINPDTGEIIELLPEYNAMSRKKGIGKEWITSYANDVYNAQPGKVIFKGRPVNAPRYYDKQLEKWDPDKYELIIEHRQKEGRKYSKDRTPNRLHAREQVALAQIKQLKRTI